MRKMLTWISGDFGAALDEVEHQQAVDPGRRCRARCKGLLHPQIADCWKPNTLSPTPAAIRTRPR